MNKFPVLNIIVLFFAFIVILNFVVDRNARLKDFIRYPNPNIWSLNRSPKFEDFPSKKIFKGDLPAVDIYSSPSAREFRTALRYAAQSGPNFASHYTIATWGCGSSCQDGMVIDISTGKVYDPFTEVTARGVDYKLNSSLVITDPADDGFFDYNLPVRYYIWKDNKLLQIYQEECLTVNDDKYLCI